MITLSEIAHEDWSVLRDGGFESLGLCSAHAGIPLLTFCGGLKFLRSALRNPDITCVLCPPELGEKCLAAAPDLGVCAVPNLRVDFFRLHNELCAGAFRERYLGQEEASVIGEDCRIDPRAVIAPTGVTIGRGTVIEPFVTIYGRTRIGENCVIRSGTVLGGSGLEFIRLGQEGILPVEHRGALVIGDRVEIQYNCNVSRSLFPWHETRIGNDTKLESLVHFAHGAHIGQRGLVGASACICGSAEIGDDVWVGPNATISSEVKVGDGARITLGAVAAEDVQAGQAVTGNFAVAHELFMLDHLRKLRGAEEEF